MPRVDLKLETSVKRSARVQQVEGMFDVPAAERREFTVDMDAPLDEREWSIGLIAGPSGSGKSSIARQLLSDELVEGYEWPADAAVLDGFPEDASIKEITHAMSSVGFSSPPAWTKPYHVLSTGERFRCDLARAILDPRETVAFDEFTSVVDRQVAKVGAHAVAKAVRKSGKRFVAITCHDDVEEWLQPDWVLEPHVERFRWRSQRRRPDVDLEIVRVSRDAWRWFAPHHYLSHEINGNSRCFAATVEGRPVAFCAVVPQPHPKVLAQRIHRLVVLPEWQGLGVGGVIQDTVAGVVRATGRTCYIASSHPSVISACARSSKWKLSRHGASRPNKSATISGYNRINPHRRTASFRYVGPKRDDALGLWYSRHVEQPQSAAHGS